MRRAAVKPFTLCARVSGVASGNQVLTDDIGYSGICPLNFVNKSIPD
jgi:hypothetical protein